MSSSLVLIVDDDQAFSEFVRKIAASCGYEAVTASGSTAVAAQLDQHNPDLILLDLQMPGVDGVELLRMLADARCTAPIVLISGFDAKVIDTARRLGSARGLRMEPALTKPIRAVDLRAVLDAFKPGASSHVH